MSTIPDTLYTLGYSGWNSWEFDSAIDRLGSATMILDIRMNPYARLAVYRGLSLQSRYKSRYRWLGQQFGNVNYKSGRGGRPPKGLTSSEKPMPPIQLANPLAGLVKLREWIYTDSLILLCGCAEHTKCHRRVVAALVRDHFPQLTRTVHLRPDGPDIVEIIPYPIPVIADSV